jgi:hypothetical protein
MLLSKCFQGSGILAALIQRGVSKLDKYGAATWAKPGRDLVRPLDKKWTVQDLLYTDKLLGGRRVATMCEPCSHVFLKYCAELYRQIVRGPWNTTDYRYVWIKQPHFFPKGNNLFKRKSVPVYAVFITSRLKPIRPRFFHKTDEMPPIFFGTFQKSYYCILINIL